MSPSPPSPPSRRIWLVPAVLLLALLLAGALQLAAAPQALLLQLPVILNDYAEGDLPPPPPPGITGVVRDGKAAAAGVPLELRRYDDETEVTASSTSTGAAGGYLFSDAATLGEDETYYVRYGPNTTDPSRVRVWFGPDILSYSAGTAVSGGDFDITDAPLLSPADGAAISLPSTFAWDQRGVGGDSYELVLYDPAGDDAWSTGNLGNSGSLEVTDIPPGAAYGRPYVWYIIIYSGATSYGLSYGEHTVTFNESNLGQTAPTRSTWQGAAPPRAARK